MAHSSQGADLQVLMGSLSSIHEPSRAICMCPATTGRACKVECMSCSSTYVAGLHFASTWSRTHLSMCVGLLTDVNGCD
jgi:hypothetical protein